MQRPLAAGWPPTPGAGTATWSAVEERHRLQTQGSRAWPPAPPRVGLCTGAKHGAARLVLIHAVAWHLRDEVVDLERLVEFLHLLLRTPTCAGCDWKGEHAKDWHGQRATHCVANPHKLQMRSVDSPPWSSGTQSWPCAAWPPDAAEAQWALQVTLALTPTDGQRVTKHHFSFTSLNSHPQRCFAPGSASPRPPSACRTRAPTCSHLSRSAPGSP